jgi:hypothetical protein
LAVKTDPDAPTPWLRRLRDVRGCRRELARVYGMGRDGELEWADASKAGSILQILIRAIEGSTFEARLASLEAAVAERQGKPTKPNGSGLEVHP